MANKLRIITFSALAILLVVAGYTFLNRNTSLPENTEERSGQIDQVQPVSLILDFGEGTPREFTTKISENETAFSLLEKAVEELQIDLITEQYDFGVFVKQIDNKQIGPEIAWVYSDNGVPGKVAADTHELNPGDLVEWKYVTPE